MIFVRIVDWINKQMSRLIGLSLLVMTIVIFLQVMTRFVFTAVDIYISIPWAEELARYLMIWIVFIGGALATRHAKLIAVDALVFAVPKVPGKLIKIFAHILSLLFYVCLLIIGIQWANIGLTVRAPVMGFSMIYVYLAMAVGAGLMILNTITLFIDTALNKKDIRDPTSNEVNTPNH
ncbi:TRAP transporter small permease [Salicibibacter kimchii]|uniref:TRAP transporter small permease n=2 Tax=Salicibibacter kimchii TaxID=2099786 RepID=A0A345BWG4_9BACI|nr:TRAP transporter small permease [Salicibibacter kimchii]